MIQEQEYEFILNRENPDSPNITIDAEMTKIKIVLNAHKLYNTMANIETILVGLNDKTKELIQKHLMAEAFKETEQRENR